MNTQTLPLTEFEGVPVEEKEVPCRFSENTPQHTSPAVARYALSHGCVCFPEDREQDLCLQHAHDCGFLGTVEPIKIYSLADWKLLRRIPEAVP